MNPWTILSAIAVLAIVYVLLPVALTTFARFRRQQNLRCPEAGQEAGLLFDPGRAALSACLGRPSLRVRNCSLWPARRGCGQACADLPESEMQEVRRGSGPSGPSPV
jgi:hypothetical protein